MIQTATSGTQLATLLTNFEDAVLSMHSGPSRPSYALAGTLWINTSSTIYTLNFWDGVHDIVIANIDTINNKPRLVIDNDNDTYLISGTRDDEIELIVQGNKKIVLSATGIRVGDGTTPGLTFDTPNTDAIALPAGTTAQRPGNGAGRIRWNSTTSKLEFNNGSSWLNVGTDIAVGVTIEGYQDNFASSFFQDGTGLTGTYDDTNNTYTLNCTVQGRRSTAEFATSLDTALVNTGDLTFTKTGNTIAGSLNATVVDTAELVDGAVTTAKLGADAVNGDKIADNVIKQEHMTDNSVGLAELNTSGIRQGGQYLRVNTDNDALEWSTVTGGGGGGYAV